MNLMVKRAIDAVGGSQGKLARLSGLSQQHISRLLNEQQRVTGEVAIKLEQATGGQVRKSDLCPHLWNERAA